MKSETWKECVLDVVRRVADRSYQEKAWFGEGDSVSSPEELICEIFDDYMYDEFLKSADIDMTPLQNQLGKELKAKLNEYSDSIGEFTDPEHVLGNPQWEKVRKAAEKFLDSFK